VVKGLFTQLAFAGFGPSLYFVEGEAARLYAVRGARPGRLRVGVRRECPRAPGVYGMVDAAGELIYVGKAKCLRTRLLSYFRPNSRDDKAGRIVAAARVVAWEPAACEFAALLRELELIRRWRPRFNVQGQPRRRRHGYVCVGRRPAPHVFLAPRPPATAFASFGPVPSGETAREAVRRVNDWFRLRDCPQAQTMVFADQKELFPVERSFGCLRHDLGACLGPCAAACSRGEYAVAVRAAVRFLEGGDPLPLDVLEREMTAASAAQEFERAAALRDKRAALEWLVRHLDRVRQAARRSCVYVRPGREGRAVWYLIDRGRVRAVVPAPAEDAALRGAAAALETVYGSRRVADGSVSLDEIDGALLVAGWFRRHPQEEERCLDPAQARAERQFSDAPGAVAH
jgi:excinuclease ABC subunit C